MKINKYFIVVGLAIISILFVFLFSYKIESDKNDYKNLPEIKINYKPLSYRVSPFLEYISEKGIDVKSGYKLKITETEEVTVKTLLLGQSDFVILSPGVTEAFLIDQDVKVLSVFPSTSEYLLLSKYNKENLQKVSKVVLNQGNTFSNLMLKNFLIENNVNPEEVEIKYEPRQDMRLVMLEDGDADSVLAPTEALATYLEKGFFNHNYLDGIYILHIIGKSDYDAELYEKFRLSLKLLHQEVSNDKDSFKNFVKNKYRGIIDPDYFVEEYIANFGQLYNKPINKESFYQTAELFKKHKDYKSPNRPLEDLFIDAN